MEAPQLSNLLQQGNLPVVVEPVSVGRVGAGVGRRGGLAAAAALGAAAVHPPRVEVLVLWKSVRSFLLEY